MRHQGVTLNFDKLSVHGSNSAVRVTQHRLQTVYFLCIFDIYFVHKLCMVWFGFMYFIIFTGFYIDLTHLPSSISFEFTCGLHKNQRQYKEISSKENCICSLSNYKDNVSWTFFSGDQSNIRLFLFQSLTLYVRRLYAFTFVLIHNYFIIK